MVDLGRYIVEYEQNGKDRAEYGKFVLKNLSQKLSNRFGRGYSEDNLSNMRKFYLCYQNEQISETVSRKFTLSWSHYLKLIRIQNIEERNFYEIEATKNNWSFRELERQFDSSLYERLALSKDKNAVKELALQGQIIEKSEDLIKDPYILEFTGLPELPIYSESELEQRLIDNLQKFLLELGKGFTFVGRQVRKKMSEFKTAKLNTMCGGSLPLAPTACGVFRYPLCGGHPRNAPEFTHISRICELLSVFRKSPTILKREISPI